MLSYAELTSDHSSAVSEYLPLYATQTNQLAELQRNINSVLEQSGFSELHRVLSSSAFSEYQKQMRYLSKVFDSIKPLTAALSSVRLTKTMQGNDNTLRELSPYAAHAHSSTDEDTAVIPVSIGKWFNISLLQKMAEDDFVAGETSASEQYIAEVADRHGWPTTMNWLNTIYLDNYSDSDILIGLMHCVSHFEFDKVKPAGPTMALGVLQHEDIFVRDYAIRAFENWNDKEAIPILKALSCEAEWLQDYVNEVVDALERYEE